jgi:uncharacterized membrane protein
VPGLREVNAIRGAGLIPAARYLEAALLVRDADYWRRWALRALLGLGAGHLLAGILFFFAYNWADMAPVAKFAVVEGGIVGTAVAAFFIGIDRPAGQAALIGASVLTGVLLAVIGQVYHTNADAYELFVAWAVLILPWALASRSAAHWLLWLVVAFVAFGLYGEQALLPDGVLIRRELYVLLGLAALIVLAVREAVCRAGFAWLGGHWTRLLPLFAGLALLFSVAAEYLLDMYGSPIGVIALAGALAVVALAYRRLLPDFVALAIIAGFAGLFLIAAAVRVLEEAIGFDWDDTMRVLSSIGLLIAWSVLVTGAGAKLLQALRVRLEGQQA